MTEASYTAWDEKEYVWPPPDGWYEASDGRWWPEGYGPPDKDPEPEPEPTDPVIEQPMSGHQPVAESESIGSDLSEPSTSTTESLAVADPGPAADSGQPSGLGVTPESMSTEPTSDPTGAMPAAAQAGTDADRLAQPSDRSAGAAEEVQPAASRFEQDYGTGLLPPATNRPPTDLSTADAPAAGQVPPPADSLRFDPPSTADGPNVGPGTGPGPDPASIADPLPFDQPPPTEAPRFDPPPPADPGSVGQPTIGPQDTRPAQADQQAMLSAPEKGTSRGLRFTVFGVLALVCIGAVLFFAFGGDSDSPATVDGLTTTGPGSVNEPHPRITGVVVFYPDDGTDQRWVVEVLEPVRDATSEYEADLAPANGVFAATRIRVTNESGRDDASLDDLRFNAVDGTGTVTIREQSTCPVGVDDFDYRGSVSLEASVEGTVCWALPSGDFTDLKLGIEATKVDGRVHILLQ